MFVHTTYIIDKIIYTRDLYVRDGVGVGVSECAELQQRAFVLCLVLSCVKFN